jgi:Flp pilus assembly protein TadG
MRVMTSHARRGASLVLVAISLVVIMLMAALTIDLGRLLSARAEAQRAADGAALAGASAFITGETGAALQDSAVVRAARVAGENEMAAQMIVPGTLQAEGSHSEVFEYVEVLVNDVLDTVPSVTADVYTYAGDEVKVDVIPTLQRVRVTVHRDEVGVWFARVVGLRSFPIGAQATANAAYAGGTRCVRPIAVMDWWDEKDKNEDVNKDQIPDPAEVWDFDATGDGDRYEAVTKDGGGTGLGSNWRGNSNDRGRTLILRNQGQAGTTNAVCADYRGNKCLGPGWWGLWDPWADDPQENASNVTIGNALTPTLTEANCATVSIGHSYGFKQGEVASFSKSFEDIWKADRNAQWSPSAEDPTSALPGAVVGCATCPDNWRASPRVWVMGLFDPNLAATIAAPGNATKARVWFNNFALFFFEGCGKDGVLNANHKCGPQDDIIGRYVGIAPGIGPGTSVLTRSLRLVK